MALTNYEKQKRWREKNRALYNLQQRKRRKKNFGGGAKQPCKHGSVETKDGLNRAIVQPDNAPPPTIPFETKKVGELRMIVMPKETVEERSTMPVVKPKVFRSETGAVITEKQYLEREEEKRLAREKGFEIDEYSQ